MLQVCPRCWSDRTKIALSGDIFDQPPDEMSGIPGKLADHIGDNVCLSPKGVVVMNFPGTESSYPPNR